MVPLATDIITSELTGRPSPVPTLKEQTIPNYGVKEAVFPFNMFQEVDPIDVYKRQVPISSRTAVPVL